MLTELTSKDIQELGLTPAINASEELGFTDFKKSSAFQLKDAYLDLENLGRLKEANPRLVIRKLIEGEKTVSNEAKVWQTWRQTVEQEHYYAKYQVTTTLVGQLSDVHIPLTYYSYQDNNFFKPFKETKAVKRLKDNGFQYARFRFPKHASNTTDIKIQSVSGEQLLRPKFAGIISKEEERKTYFRWYPQLTKLSQNQEQSPYDELSLSGYSIPYPNTVSIYESQVFNVPVKIAPKFNSNNNQYLNGIIAISTGDAEQKTVCYVSPHTLDTGYLNTVEDIYTENRMLAKSITAGFNLLATVENSSWYGSNEQGYLGCWESGYIDNLNSTYRECSIPSANKTHKRFYKLGETTKQIYFDHTLPNPYGMGRWCIALSGNANININTGHKAVVYVHQPNSIIDSEKRDPRKLSGPWAIASGHPNAAGSIHLQRANAKKPTISSYKSCRTLKHINTERLQLPSLIIDSKFLNSGYILPEGVKTETYVYTDAIYPRWAATSIITGDYPDTGLQYNPEGSDYHGYIINGQAVTMTQILMSGIEIPQIPYSGIRYSIKEDGHFQQTTPLKDTYYYKFYNSLYGSHYKHIGTGTWDGIIPPGVKFSVELISTTLNTSAGLKNGENIAIIYSGYGNGDEIDQALQTGISRRGAHILFPNPSEKYMVSGKVPWHQKRYPYRHAFNQFNQLAYTSFKSGPTPTDAINISRNYAITTINSKILQLVNKIFPDLTYKNKKWKRLQAF